MFDDLKTYFYDHVKTSLDEYMEMRRLGVQGHSQDVRKAVIAAEALFHFREHLPTGHKMSRGDVERSCPEFGLVGDIANASKHADISGNTPHGAPLVTSAKDIREHTVSTEYQDGAGTYRHVQKEVFVELTDGSQQRVVDSLLAVMDFWQRKLVDMGVLRAPHVYDPEEDEPRARERCNDGRLDLEGTVGMPLTVRPILRRYNYAAGRVEAVDTMGGHLTLTVYKPPSTASLTLTDEATGKTFSKSFGLTPEQGAEVMSIKDPSERTAYLAGLPNGQTALTEAARERQALLDAGKQPCGSGENESDDD